MDFSIVSKLFFTHESSFRWVYNINFSFVQFVQFIQSVLFSSSTACVSFSSFNINSLKTLLSVRSFVNLSFPGNGTIE